MSRVMIPDNEAERLRDMMKIAKQRIALADILALYYKNGVTLAHLGEILGVKAYTVHAMINYMTYTCSLRHTRNAFTTYIRPNGRVQCIVCRNMHVHNMRQRRSRA